MKLVRLGYWAGKGDPGWPDPRGFVDPDWDADERTQVVDYLGRGQVARAYLGVSRCRFCDAAVGSQEFSDGVFIWPEGLAHYVDKHGVRLPGRFVSHVLATIEQLEEAEADETWWRSLASPEQKA